MFRFYKILYLYTARTILKASSEFLAKKGVKTDFWSRVPLREFLSHYYLHTFPNSCYDRYFFWGSLKHRVEIEKKETLLKV